MTYLVKVWRTVILPLVNRTPLKAKVESVCSSTYFQLYVRYSLETKKENRSNFWHLFLLTSAKEMSLYVISSIGLQASCTRDDCSLLKQCMVRQMVDLSNASKDSVLYIVFLFALLFILYLRRRLVSGWVGKHTTILQIWRPGFVPASFQAGSPRAAASVTYTMTSSLYCRQCDLSFTELNVN